MKKILFTLALAICSFSQLANAALISVGPYAIDDSAITSNIDYVSSTYASNNSASAITDQSLSTFLYGAPNTTTSGTIGLLFGSTEGTSSIYNGSEADLVMYFIRANTDALTPTVDVTIGGTALTYSASLATFIDPVDGSTQKYQTLVNGEYYDVLTALVEFDDFALDTDLITGLQISGLNSDERLAMVAGFNITPVPLPAPLLLLLSGMAGLGLFRRRK